MCLQIERKESVSYGENMCLLVFEFLPWGFHFFFFFICEATFILECFIWRRKDFLADCTFSNFHGSQDKEQTRCLVFVWEITVHQWKTSAVKGWFAFQKSFYNHLSQFGILLQMSIVGKLDSACLFEMSVGFLVIKENQIPFMNKIMVSRWMNLESNQSYDLAIPFNGKK